MQHRVFLVPILVLLAAGCGVNNRNDPGAETPDADEGTTPPPSKPSVPSNPTPQPQPTNPTPTTPTPTSPPVVADAGVSAPTPPVTTADAGTAPTTPPAADGGAPPVSAEPPKDGDFNCTLVIGIAATSQWFGAGFEKVVDNAKWEVLGIHSGFIQGWADPNSDYWSKAPSSACAMNPRNPDRVIIEALYLHWMDASVEEWVTQLTAVVKNFKTKFSNIKRIELGTFVRAPMNKPCPNTMEFKSFIKPNQDTANAAVAAMFPGLVYVHPKFEVRTCGDYGGNPPHFSGAGAAYVAKMIGDYYTGASTATK
jgi:hypothetical protein